MLVTPGLSTKINTIKGVSSIVNLTVDDELDYSNKVFKSGFIIRKTNGALVLSDGVTTLNSLSPIADKVLTEAEKNSLNIAYGTGEYSRVANGVVQHNANGKIDDESLNMVADGKLVPSYLNDFIDENGIIKIEVLPESARAGTIFVDSYASLESLTMEQKKSLIYVIDATDDPSGTVTVGSAIYAFIDNTWNKIAESESIAIDVDDIACNYDNVQRSCGVMYDHNFYMSATAGDLILDPDGAYTLLTSYASSVGYTMETNADNSVTLHYTGSSSADDPQETMVITRDSDQVIVDVTDSIWVDESTPTDTETTEE